MSDNKKQSFEKSGNLGLLQDIFGTAEADTTSLVNDMVNAFPAFLKELSTGFKLLKEGRTNQSEEKTEIDDCGMEDTCKNEASDTVCEDTTCTYGCDMCADPCETCEEESPVEEEFDYEKAYKSMRNTVKYNENGDGIHTVTYTGIPDDLLEKPHAFFKWVNKIYAEAFKAALTINCNLKEGNSKRHLKNDFCIVELRFELFSEREPDTNLAVTPWHWDREMRSFYFIDENGHSNYVRFLITDGEAEVYMKGDSIVTDMISDEDRAGFIKMMNSMTSCDAETVSFEVPDDKDDKTSKEETTCDNLSCSDGKGVCGTHFDNNINANDNDKKSEGKEESLADILNSYDCKVYESSRRTDSEHEYSPLVKKIYKDILYKDSCAKETALTIKDMLKLFDYMLINNLFDHSDAGSKIIISVSYEEMMANIDKPEYDSKISPVSSRLPWFMVPGSGPHYKPTHWENLDKKLVVDSIREYYDFDEVVLIDKQTVKGDKWEDQGVEHYFLCSFEAM